MNVAQEELNGFLSIAEELKVKGLTQGNDGGSAKRARSPVASKPASYNNPVKRPRPAEQVKLAPQPPEDDDIQAGGIFSKELNLLWIEKNIKQQNFH